MGTIDLPLEVNRLSGIIVDCAFAVHTHLGPGLLESVYQKALAIEFAARDISFVREQAITITYRDQVVGENRLDFVVAKQVVVELKSVDRIADVHRSQVIHYLKATGLPLGLLLNFNCALLKDGIVRLVSTASPVPSASLRLCGQSESTP